MEDNCSMPNIRMNIDKLNLSIPYNEMNKNSIMDKGIDNNPDTKEVLATSSVLANARMLQLYITPAGNADKLIAFPIILHNPKSSTDIFLVIKRVKISPVIRLVN